MFPNYDPAVLQVGVEVEKVVRTNLLEGDAGGAVGQKAFQQLFGEGAYVGWDFVVQRQDFLVEH